MVGKSIWFEGEDGEKIEHPSSLKINLPKSGRKQRRKFAFFVQTSKSLFALQFTLIVKVTHDSLTSSFFFLGVLSLNNYQLTGINFNKKKLLKSTLFFPYKGSVLDPPKNKLQRRVFAMWDFNYSYLVLPKRKITLIFHLFFLSENLIGTFLFFFNFFLWESYWNLVGLYLQSTKTQGQGIFIYPSQKKKRIFIYGRS